jgi:hypothetical protein
MRYLEKSSKRYHDLAYRVFFTSPAELRNYGLGLPVLLDSRTLSRSLRRAIRSGPFIERYPDSSLQTGACTISGNEATATDGTTKTKLIFTCPAQTAKNRTVEDSDPRQVVNKLSEAVFSQDVSNANPT